MIYKYIDKWGVDILRDRRIKITNPSAFNDPFEFLPQIPPITKDDASARVSDSEFLDDLYESHLSDGVVSSRDQFDTWLQQNRPAVLKAVYQAYSTSNYSSDDFKKYSGSRLGVTCFSQLHDNILMWSHYADKHQGMVIAFDEGAFGGCLYDVSYVADRPKYHPVLSTGDRTKSIIETMSRKSVEWSHEQEIRVILPWQICDEDRGMSFYSVETEDIREVYLGCKAPDSLEDDVRSVLVGELAHVPLKKMRIHQDDFTLETETLI
jgi:hypothetical protein